MGAGVSWRGRLLVEFRLIAVTRIPAPVHYQPCSTPSSSLTLAVRAPSWPQVGSYLWVRPTRFREYAAAVWRIGPFWVGVLERTVVLGET